MTDTKHVVIVGSSYAGIAAAKIILKKRDARIKLTLISPDDRNYFNVAAPRLIAEPEKLSNVFFSVIDFLSKNSKSGSCKFIKGKVVKSNFNEKNVTITTPNSETISLSYDNLIIATGTRCKEGIFKAGLSKEAICSKIKDVNSSIIKSKRIVILGGGVTGVEVAGEIGSNFGKNKEVVLYTGMKNACFNLGESISQKAETQLKAQNVIVENNIRAERIVHIEGKYRAYLSNNDFVEADLILQTIGEIPNSEFIDKSYLDDSGYLQTDEYFRVEGHHEVIGLGDILSIGERSLTNLKFCQLSVFSSTADHEIFDYSNSLVPYKKGKQTIIIPISKMGGVGVLFGWQIPNFLVWLVKARDYMISFASRDLS
ncbi:Piso0_000721 [Millerozyma farinosa CBS 7064]|uniref:Piso0_000721 protein n=1 Tax=Pichia sorbitophila (strain ATCC MYA-4447 / BCRC 22081 / CBS 7064 / NBRC 10061 / NRRL Y-12695) TaxID=559304 RepID=G8YPV8_PICSO|nr:Piso0_000721 [Millerozyma farinosa CBS 7064]